MAPNDLKMTPQGRMHIMIMRSRGRVSNLFVSPYVLGLAALFLVLLAAFAIYISISYFGLLNQYGSLKDAYNRLNKEAEYLAYQNSVTSLKKEAENGAAGPAETAGAAASQSPQGAVLAALAPNPGEGRTTDQAQPSSPAPEQPLAVEPEPESPSPMSPEAPDNPAPFEQADPLENWAALHLPRLAEGSLAVESFSMNGGGFKFILAHEAGDGALAQGRILILFSVKKDGETYLSSYPELDLEKPDLESGPSYSIKSNKTFSGRIKLESGARVDGALVVAISREGDMVMKRRISLDQ